MVQLRNINTVSSSEIQQLANNYAIKKNLRDFFPFPYSVEDAAYFIESAATGAMGHVFALHAEDVFIGIGSLIQQTHEHRINAEIGYWIGEPYWGKGYATAAVKQLIGFAFEELGLLRIYAGVYDYNVASMRVLEKAGFQKEAIMHSSVIKDGKLHDEHVYSIRKYKSNAGNNVISSFGITA
jgi:ribosomal-protein-alanine N-acetyltransferase